MNAPKSKPKKIAFVLGAANALPLLLATRAGLPQRSCAECGKPLLLFARDGEFEDPRCVPCGGKFSLDERPSRET